MASFLYRPGELGVVAHEPVVYLVQVLVGATLQLTAGLPLKAKTVDLDSNHRPKDSPERQPNDTEDQNSSNLAKPDCR